MSMIINSYAFGAVSTLPTGLVSHWPLIADGVDIVSGYNLTNNGGVTFSAAGAQFTGTKTLSVADNADLAGGARDYTFSLEVNFDSLTTYAMLISKGGGGDYELRRVGDTSELEWLTGGSPAATSGLGLTTGQYYKIIVWRDQTAGATKIQVDGGAIVSLSGGAASNSSDLYFGGRGASFNLDGKLRKVRRWNRLLTSDERDEVFAGG